jgi:vacuolar iron transporter family protein
MRERSQSELTTAEQLAHHDERDPHVRARWLSDVVLGAQDGLVNTLGVVLGVAAASADARIVFAAGMAAGLAESFSMAAVGYTSSVARGDLFRSERDREYRHVEKAPAVEREEIRAIYIRKGFDGELLERVVETICANKDVWVAVMMAEEHELVPVDTATSVRSAGVVGVAALAGSVVPVIPFALVDLRSGVAAALVLGAVLLFALGAYKAKVTTGRRLRSGTELAVIGMASAVVGYAIGWALGPSH